MRNKTVLLVLLSISFKLLKKTLCKLKPRAEAKALVRLCMVERKRAGCNFVKAKITDVRIITSNICINFIPKQYIY